MNEYCCCCGMQLLCNSVLFKNNDQSYCSPKCQLKSKPIQSPTNEYFMDDCIMFGDEPILEKSINTDKFIYTPTPSHDNSINNKIKNDIDNGIYWNDKPISVLSILIYLGCKI